MLSSKTNQLKDILHSIKNVNKTDSWPIIMHLYVYIVTGQIQNTHVVQKIKQMYVKIDCFIIICLYNYGAVVPV